MCSPMSRAGSRRARKPKHDQAILGDVPENPMVAADPMGGCLAPHWLPNWHPTFRLDGSFHSLGDDVDCWCNPMATVHEHQPRKDVNHPVGEKLDRPCGQNRRWLCVEDHLESDQPRKEKP